MNNATGTASFTVQMTDSRVHELKGLLPRCLLHDWVRLGSRLARLLRDRHHPGSHDAVLERLLERARRSVALREWRAAHRPHPRYPPELPIAPRKEEILAAIRAHPVVIIAGETGSGKTTQIPKICLEAGLGIEAKIGCTQPRRVAALSVSRRIAEELGVAWGREVGCKIRFDDRSSPETFIKLMTDGMLLAELQSDPLLSEYNAIVIDEAHERSLNIDFLLGHFRNLITRRNDLKLIITSATIDVAAFSRAFGNAPVIEVSGRLYPVAVQFEPLDAAQEEEGEVTYLDAAMRVTERIIHGSPPGDILIFLPGERDIREVADQLAGRAGERAEIIPLFGRLSTGEQQRVFAPAPRRKIVVATNIAETSLTIPGIRYVVDSGLARLSRYSPRTRTRRLPIESISQSSANQRKGRAGRLEDGLCIRLYSEEDYLQRPAFTQPELQRANLAEVILRMKAFHLGEIETFPFLDPPSPAAIYAGYALLHELGALDEKRELTPLGRDLARLPIDPTLGRMLLMAQHEHATRELLIIAAGLGIQDPRERPLDRQAAADAAHRRHAHPRSDFLTLLNLWEAVHDEWESLRTQNQRRKFCKANFLSYTRMREWQDLHAQLAEALEELGSVRLNESNAAYDAVHRSILSGLIGHVARREDRNRYRTTARRQVTLFPGSVLFERMDRAGAAPKTDHGSRSKPRSHQPEWIVAGEIVETGQSYARTIGGIDARWVIDVAPHLCKTTHQNPRWNPTAGRVQIDAITTFSGFELHRQPVAYSTLNPQDASRIFLRSALVEEALLSERPRDVTGPAAREVSVPASLLPPHYRFLEHNRRILEKIAHWQTRLRRHDLGDPDDLLFGFYSQRLKDVTSREELNRWLRTNGGSRALEASESDLVGNADLRCDAEAFPDAILVGGQPVPLRYAYAPGEEHDGVTVQIPFTLADAISPALLEWSVPGLREAKAEELLRALPKALRSRLLPIAPKAAEIAREFLPSGPSLHHDLARFIHQRYGVPVRAASWPAEPLPPHLRPRLEIVGTDAQPLATGRDLHALRQQLEALRPAAPQNTPAWQAAARQWERFHLSTWSFGDLPERITISEGPGLPIYAWPGLERENDDVHVRLHRSEAAARAGNASGARRLMEIALQKELAWLRRDLRGLAKLAPLHAGFITSEELEHTAFEHLANHALSALPVRRLTQAEFAASVEAARQRLTGMVQPFIDRVRSILELRAEIIRRSRSGAATSPGPGTAQTASPSDKARSVIKDFSLLPSPGVAPSPRSAGASTPAHAIAKEELGRLLPPSFLSRIPFERLLHLPRYLKALLLRLERASVNPPKDRERARLLGPVVEALIAFEAAPRSGERQREIETLRWMLEEYRVSLFAQELGTAIPISAKRLEEQVTKVRMH
jgi:ATP-dependent helicase HrpA